MKRTLVIPLLFVIPSCMLGPNYTRPRVTIPSSFKEIGRSQQQEAVNLAGWWKVFDDDCLTELIARASQQNFDFRIAVARIEEVGAYYQINRAKLFPEADGLLALNREHYSSKLAQNEFLQANQLTLDFLRCAFSVFWELDLWGRLRRAYSAAYAEYEASIEDARGVYIVLVSNVATAYIDLRALEKNRAILKKRIEVDTALLALQKERASSGLESDILVQQTIAQLQESKSQLPLLESLYTQTQYGLALLLGELPEEFLWCEENSRYTGHVPQATLPVKTGLPSQLLRRRPDIRSAERLLASSTERIGEAIADFFPRFPLLATVGTESSSPRSWFSAGSLHWFVGVDTRWPLINFGRVTYTIQARSAVQRQALLTYCQSVVKAFSDVESALVEYSKEQERLTYLGERLEAVGKERDLSKDLFHAGLADQSSYLLIEKTYLDIERLLTDARRSVAASIIRIYKALGGGWDEVCDV